MLHGRSELVAREAGQLCDLALEKPAIQIMLRAGVPAPLLLASEIGASARVVASRRALTLTIGHGRHTLIDT